MVFNIEEQRKNLGNKLKAIRISQGRTIYYVNSFTGLKYDQIHSIEKGTASYTIDSLLKYLRSLNIRIDI